MQLATKHVSSDELLPDSSVLGQGFAGHTINDYPEPARSYHIAYARLAPYFEHAKKVPLLVCLGDKVVGIMNSIWSTQVGIIPVERVHTYLLNVPIEQATLITGDDLARISFSVHEILVELPPWCSKK